MKTKYKFFSFIMFMVLAVSAVSPLFNMTVYAQEDYITVEIQPDGTAGKDTYMLSNDPNSTAYGSTTSFTVGESNSTTGIRRGLIEFDLSGLPYNLYVDEAELQLTVNSDASSHARTLYVYAVKQSWTESHARWNGRTSSASWQTAGAAGANDFLSTPIGSVSVADNLTAGTTVTIPIDGDALVNMRKGNYFGFLLRMDVESDDAYGFRSSEYATEADRPKLTVTYAETGVPGVLWRCDSVVSINTYKTCPSSDTMSPYEFSSSISDGPWGLTAAEMICDPYPLCVNDYDLYYRLTYDFTWSSGNPLGYHKPQFFYRIYRPGGADEITISGQIECGTGSGHCDGVIEGTIPASSLPSNYSDFRIGVYASVYRNVIPTSAVMEYTFYLSRFPFSQSCSDDYVVPVVDEYEIDPTIETPLGPSGSPADDQIYTLVPDSLYMVRVADDWHDGTDTRTDAAVSFDGVEWMTWEEFGLQALCIDTEPLTSYDDNYRIYYFEAPTDEFYIRVNDTTGNFGNNSDAGAPFTYKIGEAFYYTEQNCEDQFSYDEMDVLADVEVDANEEDGERALDDTPTSDLFQAGEWYAVTVDVATTWSDNGGPATRDSQYSFTPVDFLENELHWPGESGLNWQDLQDGPLVECASSDGFTFFIQASYEELHLRVNDADDNFANNTGELHFEIFHATRIRPSEDCEMRFSLDDMIYSDSVLGIQSNGKIFATSVGSALVNSNSQTENAWSYGLVPGAWYALETTGGPWTSLNGLLRNYEMQVAEEPMLTTGTTVNWQPLDEWDMAECNIATDVLGHRLVIFQVPVTAVNQWKLRVDAEDGWSGNGGSMSWNLYRVRDLGFAPDGMCDYTYSEDDLITPSDQTVSATSTNGASLLLSENSFYAVKILSSLYSWTEGSGPDRTDMQISLNNGQTWGNIPGNNVLCTHEEDDDLVFFLHTGTRPQVKLRVNSSTFGDNTGEMGWLIYEAEAGSSILGCTTEGYSVSVLGPVEWIPVQDDQGRLISSTSASYAEIGSLVPGNTYVIETSRGPWTDGENDLDRFSAEISSDGGVTWYPLDGTNPDVNCWEAVQLAYRKIEITVIDGQVWKIRVADNESETYIDNEGNLAFTLKGVVAPDDAIVQGQFNLMGCNTPAIAPSLADIDSLVGLANYLAGWFDYGVASMVGFFAWCPQHTAVISNFGTNLYAKEPFASLAEFDQVLTQTRNEINAYSWDGGEDFNYSILDKSPAQSAAMIEDYIFSPLPDDSPWVNGDLVDFSAPQVSLTYYENCSLYLAEYVGPRLGSGVCFSSHWAKETGITFYAQMMLDIGVLFACTRWVLKEIYYVMSIVLGLNLLDNNS